MPHASSCLFQAQALLLGVALGACTPERDQAPSACAAGETLAADGCVPATCGEVPWADEMVAAWVSADAADGGDGSEQVPFRTIGEGLDAAALAGGGVVAVRPGTYAGPLALGEEHEGVQALGRCPALVHLELVEDEAGIEAALPTEGEGATLSGLRLAGGVPGVWLRSGTLTLRDLVIEDSFGAGIQVGRWGRDADATLSLKRVEVRGTRAREGSEEYTDKGVGILVLPGATLDAAEVLVEDSAAYGVWAYAASASLRVLRVMDAGEFGVVASMEADLALSDALISGVAEGDIVFSGTGLFVESGSAVRAERLSIQDTEYAGVFLDGLYGENSAYLEDLKIARATRSGVVVFQSRLDLKGCGIEDLLAQPTDSGEFERAGVEVQGGSLSLSCDRLAVNGAQVRGWDGSALEIVDTELDGSLDAESYNPCMEVSDAELTLSGVEIHDCAGGGVRAERSALSLAQVTVRSSGGVADSDSLAPPLYLSSSSLGATDLQVLDSHGAALLIDYGSEVTLRAALVEGVYDTDIYASAIGVAVQRNASLDASALEVRGVEGVGLYQSDARVSCTDCVFEDLEFAGIAALGRSTLTLPGTRVAGVAPSESLGGGVGIAMVHERGAGAGAPLPTLTLREGEVEAVELASIYLDGKGSYEIRDSVLAAGEGAWTARLPVSNVIFATGGVTTWDESDLYKGLLVDGVELVGGEGGAIFLDGSSATLRDLTFTDVARTLVQDRCDGVPEPEGIEEIEAPELCPTYDYPLGLLNWYLYTLAFEVEG